MAYAANILPVEAAYYDLTNASITGGILSISPNGVARYTVTSTDIAALTEKFRVAVLPQPATSGYAPRALIRVSATTVSNVSYDFTMVPSSVNGSIVAYELDMEEAEYTTFTFSITSLDEISFTLWELCPEASEEIDMTIIEGVQQSLPKLLYDYNMTPLAVGQDEETIGLITFNLLDNTDLQGHFAITCVASEACILTLRFKDTGITELFSPMLYDLQPGRSSIGIPHSYLHRLAGNHSTYVTAQVSSGSLAIGTRAILYTIDGGYLAERIADLGIIIEDVSISQHIGDYTPDYIWAIGIDGGEAMVRRKAYTAKAHIAFDPMYSVGQAKHAAIEFNGHWRLRTDLEETIYTLVTEANPYIFLVDMDDNLVVQVGNDASTRITLDTGVSSVSVCRAYDSIIYPQQDQGLICLYLKSGMLYYCQHCYSDGRHLWTGPFQLTVPDLVGTIKDAYVHRLNDYRVSVVVTTDEANYWLISDRTYVGQTVKPERIDFMYSEMAPLTAMVRATDTITTLRYTQTRVSDDGKTLTATFNCPVRVVAEDAFLRQLSVDTGYEWLTSVSASGNDLVITSYEAITNDSIMISYPATTFMQYNAYGTFWYHVPAETLIFSGAHASETATITYGSVSGRVTQRGIETIRINQLPETLSVLYGSVSGNVVPYAITTSNFTQYPETASLAYNEVTGTVTMIQTGVSPI